MSGFSTIRLLLRGVSSLRGCTAACRRMGWRRARRSGCAEPTAIIDLPVDSKLRRMMGLRTCMR